MFDTIFEMLYALFLLIVISIGNNIFMNRNNNNHVILVEEDMIENEQRTVVNNNNNNNDIIRHILNPDDDTDIDITGNAIISRVAGDFQIFGPTLSLLRDGNQLSGNGDSIFDNSAIIEEEEEDSNENVHTIISDNTTDNSDNDLYLSLSDHLEEEEEETTNNNSNLVGSDSDIIRHVLNPNNNDMFIFITGSVTISLFENNSQQFGNYPVYRVLHNERREGNNENVEYLL